MQIKSSKIFPVLGLLAALFLAGCNSGGGKSSKPNAKVSIFPSSVSLNSGDEFTSTVELKNIEETFYVAFDMTYDSNIIEYIDATEGGFLKPNVDDATSFQIALQEGEPGRITVGLTRLGKIGGVTGGGTLLSVSFKALSPGTTTLAFTDPKALKSSTDQDVTVDLWENSTITVQ